MGAGTRIYDVTDPRLPRFVGGYTDPGWQNDVQLFGDTMITAFDPLGGPVHLSDCLQGQEPHGAARAAWTSSTSSSIRCLRPSRRRSPSGPSGSAATSTSGGGAHTITVHPSGQWLSVNTVGQQRHRGRGPARQPASRSCARSRRRSSPRRTTCSSRATATRCTRPVSARRASSTSATSSTAPDADCQHPQQPVAPPRAPTGTSSSSRTSPTRPLTAALLIVTDEKGGGLSADAVQHRAPIGNNIGGASLLGARSPSTAWPRAPAPVRRQPAQGRDLDLSQPGPGR